MKPLRTNPAYLYLAHRKALLQHVVNYLMYDVVGGNGREETKIYSDDVFQADAEVPTEEIVRFAEELQSMEAEVRLEMGKFEFIRKSDESSPEENAQNPEQKKEDGTN